MLTYHLYVADGKVRREEAMAQAKRYRLGLRVSRLPLSPTARYYHWLARLGDLMVAWGCQLQTRFAVETNAGTQGGCA